MKDSPRIYAELRSVLNSSSSSPEQIKDLLPSVRALMRDQDERIARDAFYLLIDSFRMLRDATVDDPAAAQSFILDAMLPELEQRDLPVGQRHFLHYLREDLVKWIEQYQEPERTSLRNHVLDELIQRVASSDPRNAIWTIIQIGYRREDLPAVLRSIARKNPDELGDLALLALADLGTSTRAHPWLLRSLHTRTRDHWSLPLNQALRLLGSPASLDVVYQSWLSSDAVVKGIERFDRSYALRILTSVADKHDRQKTLQDTIWSRLAELWRGQSEEYELDLYLGSDVIPLCNSQRVVPDVLQWLTGSDTSTNMRLRYLLYSRLIDSIRPLQLKGWGQGLPPAALTLVREDAFLDTKILVLAHTEEAFQKEAAWEIALTAGSQEALSLEWFRSGVENETSPFDQAKILDRLACFRLDPIPDTLTRWVREHLDTDKQLEGIQRDAQLTLRISAMQVMASAESRDSFETLLNFGLEVDGQVLRDSADALADVAASLIRTGDRTIEQRLVEVACDPPAPRHRTAAIGALERLSLDDLLTGDGFLELEALLFHESVPEYELSTVVAILGYVSGYKPSERVVNRIQGWAAEPQTDLGRRSLGLLAHKHLLEGRDELLRNALGLERTEEGYRLVSNPPRFEEWSRLVGLLYTLDPYGLQDVIVYLLESYGPREWFKARELLSAIAFAHSGADKPPVSDRLRAAILAQTRIRQGAGMADTSIFDLLARILPDDLASEDWSTEVSNWIPDSRAALADALGEAVYSSRLVKEKATRHLLMLAGDSQYAVRRSAYRALLRLSSEDLAEVCHVYIRSADVQRRQRAAEAYGWLARNEF